MVSCIVHYYFLVNNSLLLILFNFISIFRHFIKKKLIFVYALKTLNIHIYVSFPYEVKAFNEKAPVINSNPVEK
jgi:hypothetical protein